MGIILRDADNSQASETLARWPCFQLPVLDHRLHIKGLLWCNRQEILRALIKSLKFPLNLVFLGVFTH